MQVLFEMQVPFDVQVPFGVEEREFDGVPVLVVVGELDFATAPGLSGRIVSVGRRARALIVDLSGVDFCDSTGLRALSDCDRQLAIQRTRLVVVVAPDGVVARLFDVAGARQLLEVHPTSAAAMAALAAGDGSSVTGSPAAALAGI
jgi:anti-sigma B factor antagonist